MNSKALVVIAVAAVLLGTSAFFLSRYLRSAHTVPQVATSTFSQPITIEAFVAEMISKLSPVKEQLGGKFYITKIDARNGTGTVYFEDGHSAYVADFAYVINGAGVPSVTTFTIRK